MHNDSSTLLCLVVCFRLAVLVARPIQYLNRQWTWLQEATEEMNEIEMLTLPLRVAECLLEAAGTLLAAGEDVVVIGTLAPISLTPRYQKKNSTMAGMSARAAVKGVNDILTLVSGDCCC